MLFYVPPLLPVMATVSHVDRTEQSQQINPVGKHWPDSWLYDTTTRELFGTIDAARPAYVFTSDALLVRSWLSR